MLSGVFVSADLPDTVELRAAAAARVVGSTSAITDRTAAWIHGVDVHTCAEHDVFPPVESCVLRWNFRSRRGALAALDQFMRLHGLRHQQLSAEAIRFFRRYGAA